MVLNYMMQSWWLIGGVTLASILLLLIRIKDMIASYSATPAGLILGYLIGGVTTQASTS